MPFVKNAEAWLKKHTRFAKDIRFAKETPTQLANPIPGPQAPAAQPIKPKRQFPATLDNCKVTFNGSHDIQCIITPPGMPDITLHLTHEQRATVEARLAQKSWGAGGGTWNENNSTMQNEQNQSQNPATGFPTTGFPTY